MEKTPRYTQRERNMVLGFAAQYKDIIENKRTDAESNRRKDEVWRTIAKEFNARVYHQRTSKQLRQLYKNMKLLLKKDLSIDGHTTKNFMDILNALSQQTTVNPFLTTYRENFKAEYDDEPKGSSSYTSDNIESDVVIIKSEDLSDNDNNSIKNDDDTISNKDIPEVCLNEEDDDDFINDISDDNLNTYNYYLRNHYNNNNINNNNNNNNADKCNSLMTLAVEEKKRKIDLLNAQIDYWKALTRKLEMTNNNNNHCHCHIQRVNNVNQS